MSNLRIAFFRAEHGAVDDYVINKGSGGLGYSHCEIMINPTTMVGAHYSNNGVNMFYYNDVMSSPAWDVVELDFKDKKAVKYVKSMIGTEYDTIGVVFSFLGIDAFTSDTKVWCSELAALAFNEASDKYKIDNTLVMPNELFRILTIKLKGKVLPTNVNSIRNAKYFKPTIDRFGRVGYGRIK